jgi:hypothetical protein
MNFEEELELRPKVAWFLSATNWVDARRLVDQYPMLLTDEALAMVESSANELKQCLPEDAWFYDGQCEFLRRCREVGAVKAYDEVLRRERSRH